MPCELLQQGSAISPCSAHLQTEAKTIKEDQIGIYIYIFNIYIYICRYNIYSTRTGIYMHIISYYRIA